MPHRAVFGYAGERQDRQDRQDQHSGQDQPDRTGGGACLRVTPSGAPPTASTKPWPAGSSHSVTSAGRRLPPSTCAEPRPPRSSPAASTCSIGWTRESPCTVTCAWTASG